MNALKNLVQALVNTFPKVHFMSKPYPRDMLIDRTKGIPFIMKEIFANSWLMAGGATALPVYPLNNGQSCLHNAWWFNTKEGSRVKIDLISKEAYAGDNVEVLVELTTTPATLDSSLIEKFIIALRKHIFVFYEVSSNNEKLNAFRGKAGFSDLFGRVLDTLEGMLQQHLQSNLALKSVDGVKPTDSLDYELFSAEPVFGKEVLNPKQYISTSSVYCFNGDMFKGAFWDQEIKVVATSFTSDDTFKEWWSKGSVPIVLSVQLRVQEDFFTIFQKTVRVSSHLDITKHCIGQLPTLLYEASLA